MGKNPSFRNSYIAENIEIISKVRRKKLRKFLVFLHVILVLKHAIILYNSKVCVCVQVCMNGIYMCLRTYLTHYFVVIPTGIHSVQQASQKLVVLLLLQAS